MHYARRKPNAHEKNPACIARDYKSDPERMRERIIVRQEIGAIPAAFLLHAVAKFF